MRVKELSKKIREELNEKGLSRKHVSVSIKSAEIRFKIRTKEALAKIPEISEIVRGFSREASTEAVITREAKDFLVRKIKERLENAKDGWVAVAGEYIYKRGNEYDNSGIKRGLEKTALSLICNIEWLTEHDPQLLKLVTKEWEI